MKTLSLKLNNFFIRILSLLTLLTSNGVKKIQKINLFISNCYLISLNSILHTKVKLLKIVTAIVYLIDDLKLTLETSYIIVLKKLLLFFRSIQNSTIVKDNSSLIITLNGGVIVKCVEELVNGNYQKFISYLIITILLNFLCKSGKLH